MKIGLLMEAVQEQQRLAANSLAGLQRIVLDLDGAARDEIRRVTQEELLALTSESRRAIEALIAVRRVIGGRLALGIVGVCGVCCAVTLAITSWILPSTAEIERLRVRRDELVQVIARLEQHGGLLDIRRCGAEGALCVRVDRKAPAYGPAGDYLLAKGR